jgi:presqualene diphosphate phosphatase
LTKKFVSFLLNFVQIRSFKTHCKFLEWSCHGIVWLAGLLAFTYMFDNKDLYQMQVNLFMALIIDIFVVAIIKAIARRRRPSVNDDPFCIGPDVYSFPSGHASRASLLLVFFTCLDPFSIFFWPPLLAWWFAISISRLLLYRHHILDVVGGIVLGFTEAIVIGIIWIGPDTAKSLIKWISDEKNIGNDAEII